MRGIILKLNTRITGEGIYDKIADMLHQQWVDKSMLLLPKEVDLLAVIDDDEDVSIVMAADEVIKNDKPAKIE